MIRGLVVTHGDLGVELVKVVEQVMGAVADLSAISNQGLSALALTEEIQRWLAEAAAAPGAVIFIDDFGGSCANAVRLACGEDSEVTLLCGVNLAMLLAFTTWRESTSLSELAQRLVDKGRAAIVRVDPAARI